MTRHQEQTGTIAGAAVMGNFQLTATMPNGKSFSVSGYIFEGESQESLNQRIDLLHDVTDRQRTRSEIPELEHKRDQVLTSIEQMRDVMAELEAKQTDGKKLASNEKQMLENMRKSLVKALADVDKGNEAIAEAKRKSGMA